MLSPRAARINLPLSLLTASSFATITTTTPLPSIAKPTPLFDQSLSTYFPGSIPSNTALLRLQSTLRKRQYFPYNTLLASSLPSDEIVHTPTSLISQLRSKLCEAKDGGVYALGGLDGIPFTGDAGMKDLLSHGPKDGRILIVFGPHIGIDQTGTMGMVERIGRSDVYVADPTPSVVVNAYHQLMKGVTSGGGSATGSATGGGNLGLNLEEEYIMNLLKKMPLKEYQASKGGDNYALAKVTQNIYALIAEAIERQVQNAIANQSDDFWDRTTEVTMIGGVVINRGHGSKTEGGDDFFQPLMAKTLVKGGQEVDLFKEVFGDLSTPGR